MRISLTCPECEHEFETGGTPGREARVSGPPENCYPAEGPEFDETVCPECGAEIPEETLQRALDDAIEAAEEDAAERKAEAREENRRWGDEIPGD